MSITNNLVGVWNFDDGSASDSIGQNHGSDPGVIYETQSGRSYAKLNGSSDYINLGPTQNIPFGGTSDFTISIWINPDVDSSADWQQIFGSVITGTTSLPYAGIHLGIRPNELTFTIGGNGSYSGELHCPLASTLQGAWNHITVTRSGTEIKFYVNGIPAHTATVPSTYNITPAYNGWHLYSLGAYYWHDQLWRTHYAGKLDDLRLWSRKISDLEVAEVYNTSNPTPLGPNTVRLRVISKGIN